MRSTPDLPTDTLGSLGQPIRPEAPKPADVVKPFESGDHSAGIGNQSKAIETMVESILPTVTDGQADDWEGLCAKERRRWHASQALHYIEQQRSARAISDEERKGWADAAEFLKNLPEYGGLL